MFLASARLTPTQYRSLSKLIREEAFERGSSFPIEVIDGAAYPHAEGHVGYYTNKSGELVLHPNAYRNKFGRATYHPSTRRIIVGRDWLALYTSLPLEAK